MAFPARDDAASVVESGKEPLEHPAALRASQRPSVLGRRASAPVGGDYCDALLHHESGVEAVTVVAPVADQPLREIGEEARVECGGDEMRLRR